MPAPVLQFKRGAFANLPGLRAGEPGFTTDKYDLYVGLTSSVATNKFFGSSRYWTRETASSGSGVNFVENTTGTDYITLRAPSNLSGIGTYTLPDTNTIVDGYFLKVGAGGSLSWDTVASVSGGTLTNTSLTGITTISGTFFDVNTNADFSGITTFVGRVDVQDNLSVAGFATFTQAITGNISTATRARTIDITTAPNGVYYPALLNTATTGVTSVYADSGIFYVAQTDTLFVNGNVSIGGTSGILFVTNLFVNDKDIVVGYTTDVNGNDASKDSTSTHGGIAVASTTGSPLFNMPQVAGVNSLPFTYKQFMWIAAGTNGYTGMSTDAWVSNYPIAIGTATVQNQSRFTVGAGYTFYDTYLDATSSDLRVRNINAGIITASSFVGSFSGTATTATNATYAVNAGVATYASSAGIATYASTSGIATYATTSGVSTYASSAGIATYASSAGIATYASTAGIATYAPNSGFSTASGVSTSVSGGTASVIQLNNTGISTLGITSTTNLTTQQLNISGFSTFAGIATHTASLFGTQASFTGVVTANSFVGSFTGTASNATYAVSAGVATYASSAGIATYATTSGVSTYASTAGIATYATTSGVSTYASTAGIATYAPNAGFSTSAGISSALTSTASVNTSGIITASSFTGSLTGTATTATRAISIDVVGVATNQNYNIALFDGSGNAKNVGVDAELLYNPNTNSLTLGIGVGVTAFFGAVSTGSSATSVPTSKAVIDYVATQVGNVDLTTGLNADSGGPSTFNTSQTLTISGTANQVQTAVSGQTVTVSLPSAVIVGTSLSAPTLKTSTIQSATGTNALSIASNGAVTTLNNLTVTGDLFVNGNTTEVNTTSLNVYDRTITLGLQTGATPTTTTWDLGILMNYGDAGVAKTAGVVWDYATRRFRFGIDTDNPASSSTTTPQIGITTYASIEVAGLWINNACSGGAQEVIGCVGAELQLQNIVVDGGVF